jgi:signal transduction histidine kinase
MLETILSASADQIYIFDSKLEFNPAPLDLAEFCHNLVEELQLNAGSNNIICYTSQGKFANACMDENLLRKILTNLLSNAIKYSPEGGTVFFELSCDDEAVTFCIQDISCVQKPCFR